jgi:hypothetical protein
MSVDPLLAPPEVSVDITGMIGRATRGHPHRPPWAVAADSELRTQIAAFLPAALAAASARVGTYEAFAREFDDDYLHLDAAELAEAVAYAWLVAGAVSKALPRLERLIALGQVAPGASSDRTREEGAVAERAQQALRGLIADEQTARRTLISSRADNLRRWGSSPSG